MSRSYSELITYIDFFDRFEYLKTSSTVGEETFGVERYLNQRFYQSREWKEVRHEVIIRDNGCDLGISSRPLSSTIYIHHMNPITTQDLVDFNPDILNPEFLISVSHRTHNAIHYGNASNLLPDPVERRPGDTVTWKRR